MSTPLLPQPTPEQPAKVEYDRLTAYFDKLVKYSLLAIGTILAIAGAFLWKNTSDVQSQAAASIKATQDSATHEISEIGKAAQATAKDEAQKAIEAAFEKQNVQRMIDNSAQKRVDAAVEIAVQKNLGTRIEAFRNLIGEIGEISNAGAQLRQNFGQGLETLLKKRESHDPTVKAYASSTLTEIAADYESSLTRFSPLYQNDPNFFFFGAAVGNVAITPKLLMEIIRHSTGQFAPQQVAQAFLDMKKRVRWDVQMFDIPAAEKWCTQHKPKCDEDSPTH